MLALDDSTGVTHHLITEYSGDVDERVLECVWRSLGRVHPILQSTLSRGERVWTPTDRELGFASIRVTDADEADSVVQVLCASRLGNDPVEPGRLTLVRGGRADAVVVMSLHHAVVDGRGAFVVFDDLRSGYVSALLTGRAPPVTVDTTPRTIASAALAANVDVSTRASIIRAAARRWAEVVPSSHCAAIDRSTTELPTVRAFRWAPSPVARLTAIRRIREWTVTDVILGALARAWEEAIGRDHSATRTSGWLVTADTRPRLGLTRGIGTFSGTEPVALGQVGSGWPEDSVATAAAALHSVRHGYPGAGADLAAAELEALGAPIPPWLSAALFRYGGERSRYTRAIANFGVLPDRLRDWGPASLTDLWWAPPLADPPYVNATFTSLGDSLTLSLRVHPRGISSPLAHDLAGAFAEVLDDLAEGPGHIRSSASAP